MSVGSSEEIQLHKEFESLELLCERRLEPNPIAWFELLF